MRTLLTEFKDRELSRDGLQVSGRRIPLTILVGVALICATSDASAQTSNDPADNAGKQTASTDVVLERRWKKLTSVEAAEVARKHIHGLVRAAHLYHDKHGAFPPAVVPNRDLPAGKRLSGLVLLLPYLHAESGIEKGEPCFDAKVVRLAKELHWSIDLTKAWDDPVNLKAAKTVVPAFIAPQNGIFRNRQGFAVCHFAMVQGSANGLDGAFPGEVPVKIADIEDGTVSTLAFGQISHDVGPWMAEGLTTARQVYPPTRTSPSTFGSLYHKSGCYFAMCDSTPFFMVFSPNTNPLLDQISTRAGGELINNFEVTRVRNPFER